VIFGAHVSVSGGYLPALDYARSVGCECVQIFAKSPRQWRGAVMDPAAAAAFVEARETSGFGPLFTHTAYLINLSTNNTELWEKSVAGLADELVRGAMLGASGVVTHIGNVPDGDREAAARRTAEAILRAYELAGEAASGTRLLLENTAGAGSTYGASFEELAASIEHTGLAADRLGFCFDTCHAFAQGAALDTAEGWRETVDAISACLGMERLGLMHLNDCKFERGSRKDRHEWIGDGFIGNAGFEAMVCVPELADVPGVTEMPGEVPDKDSVNNERLRRLREECAPSR
jgi:deoxyribonuclease-4